jgi:hypothetical protein
MENENKLNNSKQNLGESVLQDRTNKHGEDFGAEDGVSRESWSMASTLQMGIA